VIGICRQDVLIFLLMRHFRFWFENPNYKNAILGFDVFGRAKFTRLSDIVLRNTKLRHIQRNLMYCI